MYIQGTIDQPLIDRLTPKIISLHCQNREPITVYIDSRGGSTLSAEILLRLLSASNQDSSPACRLITVVTSLAASAAADLLSSGDYAIGYAESTILYHGVRFSLDDPVTVERASFLTETLKLSNDKYAMALARRSNSRFIFRYVSLRSQFQDYREAQESKTITDLDCFLALISMNLSPKAIGVVAQARKRNTRYEALLNRVFKKAGKTRLFNKGKRLGRS